MIKFQSISPLARKGLLSLALVAPLAIAGHLNKLVTADLDGRQEIKTGATDSAIVGDPDGRGEFYAFSIDNTATNPITVDPNVLCYNLQVKRIGELDLAPAAGTRMAHIHKGKAGANGPVVANLAWPQGGQAADCLNSVTQQARFNNVGIEAANAVIADILANPEEYYVNVHNAEYPAGAIRGQVRVAAF
jgi:hypothetical protein